MIIENVEWHPSTKVEHRLQHKYDWLREAIDGVRVTDPKLRCYESPSSQPGVNLNKPQTADPTHRPGSSTDGVVRADLVDVPAGADISPPEPPNNDDNANVADMPPNYEASVNRDDDMTEIFDKLCEELHDKTKA